MRRVERFSGARRDAPCAVYIRATWFGAVTQAPGGPELFEVRLEVGANRHAFALMLERERIVAMEVAGKWEALEAMLTEPPRVETYDHRRGQGLKFPDPESAAAHLEGLGWSVTPPAPRGGGLAMAIPAGGGRGRFAMDGRYYVQTLPPTTAGEVGEHWVRDRITNRRMGPYALPEAFTEAERLNLEDDAR